MPSKSDDLISEMSIFHRLEYTGTFFLPFGAGKGLIKTEWLF